MPGAVPLDDLPNELRGMAVPMDDLPSRAAPPSRDPVEMPDWSPTARGVRDTALGIPGVGLLANMATGAINVGAKIPAGIAGLLGLVTGGVDRGADWANKTRDALTLPPVGPTNDPIMKGMELLGRGAERVAAPLDRAVENAGPGISTFVPAATEAVADIAGVVPAGAGLNAGRSAATAAKAATTGERAIREAGAVAPTAKAAGFDVTPSTVAGTRSVKPKGFAALVEGNARNPEASLRNAQQLNRRLGDELGIQVDADGRLDPGAFDSARQPAFSVYDEAKGVPGAQSPEYTDAVTRAIQGVDVPTEAMPEVARMVQKYSTVGDSAQLVEDLKNLRRTASKRREGDTANQVANEALADVQMAIADELENELGRRASAAGDAGLQQRLQQARQHLAQLYETERATHGGFVDATELAARQQKTGRLTGELQLGAHMGENLPDVFQHPQNAAPAAMGHTPEAWGARSFLFRTAERLGGGLLSRKAMKNFNERIPVGPNALDEFNISPVRDRGYPSPMGPNAGPQAPPPPPSAPPGLFAEDLAPPRAPNMPSAGRPEPSGPAFNQSLADQLAGDLQLEGALPPPPAPRLPQSRPLDTVDFTRPEPPGAPVTRSAPPPSDPVGTVDRMSYEGQPRPFAEALNPDLILWEPPGKVDQLRGPTSSFADQLGPVAPRLDESLAGDLGMPVPPRGINEAQLSSPAMPDGFRVAGGPMDQPQVSEAARRIADMRRPKPRFGPDDEFPGAAAPVEPQGPAPSGGEGGIADMLYRGVPEGADPMAPNARGFTTWAPDRPTAERYGPTVGEAPFDPATNVHLGTLEDARMLLGLGPEATAQDIAEAAMRRFGGANKTASYDLPPELGGTPREFIRFDNQ